MITDSQFSEIAGEGTPAYVYDIDLLRNTLEKINKSAAINPKFRVHYAVKANGIPEILETVRDAGIGLDTVSGGEIESGLKAGFEPQSIVYAGVGKTDREIDLALKTGIGVFNVESLPELEIISQRAVAMGKEAQVALRINPDIDAHTHHYITTGLNENKFGINLRHLDHSVDLALSLPGIKFAGLHFHIGSQITIAEPFVILCKKINEITRRLADRGITLRYVNVGGGLAIDYDNPRENPIPDFEAYFNTFNSFLDTKTIDEVHFELGRAIVGQCGYLVTKVIYVKTGDTRTFAIVDAGMNDLIRPALYQARHEIRNISGDLRHDPPTLVDVVGPICESADEFGKDYSLSAPHRGDVFVIYSAGAYGQAMSSSYNSRTPARICIK